MPSPTTNSTISTFAGLGGSVVSGILAIFHHHSQAVKTEAAALNSAVPAVEKSWSDIVAGFDAGTITADQAKQGIDASLTGYDSLVYSGYGVKQKSGNGPDTVRKTWLAPWAGKIDALIAQPSGGVFTSDAIPAHAGFSGLAPFTLDVTPPSATGSSIASTLTELVSGGGSGSSSWVIWAVGIVLLILFLKR